MEARFCIRRGGAKLWTMFINCFGHSTNRLVCNKCIGSLEVQFCS